MRSRRRWSGLAALAAALSTLPLPLHAAVTEVLSAHVELRLEPQLGEIAELARMRLRAQRAAAVSFAIDPCLTLETVTASAHDSSFEGRKVEDTIEVRFDPPLDGETTLTFRLSGRPRCTSDGPLTSRWVALGSDDEWYPRLPGAIGEAELVVAAPPSWTILATGAEVASERPSEARRFRSADPIAGLAVAGGPDLEVSEAPLVRSRLRLAGPPGGPDATALAALFADPFSWLSAALAAYPFESFQIVRLPGLPRRVRGSGLIAIPAEAAIAGPEDGADLLAGQWLGERVRGDGRWMEALAAWQAVAYARDRARPLPADVTARRDEYRTLDSSREPALSRADLSASDAVVRGRGSVAPDMVRLVLGDRPWFAAVDQLNARPLGSVIALEDLRRAVAGGSDTGPPAFREWFERPGIPRLRVHFGHRPASSGGYRADVRIEQPGLVFHLPVEVVFHGAGGASHRERIELTGENTVVFYVLDFDPLRLEIDPLGRLFQHPPELLAR